MIGKIAYCKIRIPTPALGTSYLIHIHPVLSAVRLPGQGKHLQR